MAADIVLSDCIVPVDHNYQAERIYGANICIDCKNACGDCEWSEIDPITKHPRFAPVPGWTAKKVLLASRHGKEVTTFRITECPKFDGALKRRRIEYGRKKRPVIAISPDGTETRYESIGKAAKAKEVDLSNVKHALSGASKTAGGYKWRYADAK